MWILKFKLIFCLLPGSEKEGLKEVIGLKWDLVGYYISQKNYFFIPDNVILTKGSKDHWYKIFTKTVLPH